MASYLSEKSLLSRVRRFLLCWSSASNMSPHSRRLQYTDAGYGMAFQSRRFGGCDRKQIIGYDWVLVVLFASATILLNGDAIRCEELHHCSFEKFLVSNSNLKLTFSVDFSVELIGTRMVNNFRIEHVISFHWHDTNIGHAIWKYANLAFAHTRIGSPLKCICFWNPDCS